MVANILSFKPLSTFSSRWLLVKQGEKNPSHQCHTICGPSAHQESRVVPGIVILTHSFFLFISFVRTGTLPSFSIFPFSQLYAEALFWLILALSIFYQNSQHFVPLLFDGSFLSFKTS